MELKETILQWAREAGVSHGPLAGQLTEIAQELLTVREHGHVPPRPRSGLAAKGHWWPGGVMRWRVVDIETGTQICERTAEEGSINVAEFMAILDAIAWADDSHYTLPIYSPSVVAINWIQNRLFKTSANTPNWIRDLVRIFNSTPFSQREYVTLWDQDSWGPSPAAYQDNEYTMKWVAR